VAVGAHSGRNGVRVGQRESRGRVIKLAVCPDDRVVAAFTRCGEAQLDVVNRSRRRVVILQMA
jgi:hypothetical protein